VTAILVAIFDDKWLKLASLVWSLIFLNRDWEVNISVGTRSSVGRTTSMRSVSESLSRE
jgi:hypothetical protein